MHRLLILAALSLATQTSANTLSTIGYVGWWLPEGWRTVSNLPLSRIHFFDISITDSGALGDRRGWPQQWGALQKFAAARGIPIDLTLTMMDQNTFHRVFSDPAAIARLLDQSVEMASQEFVSGIHLDVEMYSLLNAADITAYRKFVRDLVKRTSELSPPKSTSVFLPFQLHSLLYDSATLQGLSHVVVQGYDSHWLESKNAGPIAPLDGPYALTWKKAVAYADGLGIPRSMQFMGYPLYGYEWRVSGIPAVRSATQGKGTITTFAPQPSAQHAPEAASQASALERAQQHGATYDALTASSYYRYQSPHGQRWEGWFDDWLGLQKKTNYASQSELGGIAFFLLGYDNGLLIDFFHRSNFHAPSSPP